MPSTVADVFAAAGLSPDHVVRWATPLPEPRQGVYVVSLTERTNSVADARPECPLSLDALEGLLAVRPELRVDGVRPSRADLAERLSRMWLGDEVIAYIGLAGTSLHDRVGAYYSTPLGARRPHAGGWPLKTLGVLRELWVHFAVCADPGDAEHRMLGAFQEGVSPSSLAMLHDPNLPLPFANLEWAKGQRKAHGISGAREPRKVAAPTATDGSRATASPATSPARSADARPRPRKVQAAGPLRSLRVTEKDIAAGRIRFPSSAKVAFPSEPGLVDIDLRGLRVTVRWHPHYDPDQERSGVLSVGREALAKRVAPDEVLAVVAVDGRTVLS